MKITQAWKDDRVANVIGTLLRAGVFLSATVVLSGLVIFLVSHGAAKPHYSLFQGEPAGLRGVSTIVGGAATMDGRSLIQFGLLLLILTPVARVAFSVLGFALERDRTYVAVTLIVLSVLLYSLGGGYR
jgi:uncharacterized membrane protein